MIDGTGFGWISVEGERFEHDIVIRLSGAVKKRKKKLSKAVYGTSHHVSLDEAEAIYEKGCETLVVGSGQYGELRLSEEAEAFFRERKVRILLVPTPEALELFNRTKGKKIGMFHVTC